MEKDERTFKIIGAAMEVHKHLGCGFSEYVYQDALEIEFQKRRIPYVREKQLKVEYKGITLKHDFFADFVCFENIIVECKAVKDLCDQHRSQLINYLKATGNKLGLLINFGDSSLEYERLVK